jgi:hypothetical protein
LKTPDLLDRRIDKLRRITLANHAAPAEVAKAQETIAQLEMEEVAGLWPLQFWKFQCISCGQLLPGHAALYDSAASFEDIAKAKPILGDRTRGEAYRRMLEPHEISKALKQLSKRIEVEILRKHRKTFPRADTAESWDRACALTSMRYALRDCASNLDECSTIVDEQRRIRRSQLIQCGRCRRSRNRRLSFPDLYECLRFAVIRYYSQSDLSVAQKAQMMVELQAIVADNTPAALLEVGE